MSKKIVSMLLMILVVFSCTLTAFCEQDASQQVITVTAAEYNEAEKKVTLTIKNTGNEDIQDSMLAFQYDENAIAINNYPGYILTGEMEAGAQKDIILSAAIANYDGTLPKMGASFQYITATDGTIDLTQDTATAIKAVEIENIFAATAEEESSFFGAITGFLGDTGFAMIGANWKVLVMILISFVLMYLAIVKKFEPLLLLPIAFGMLLTNLPGAEMYHTELFADGHVHWDMFGG